MRDIKSYRDWAPRQSILLPVSPLDWLPKGHLAYFILDVVDQLDLSAIEQAIQAKDLRGNRPYSPAMMTAVLLYAYCVGVFSSRRIARATIEDIAFRVLSAGTQPHFTTINQFRKDHLKALEGLFVQVVKMCRKAGLIKLGVLAIDGTKVQGNASKHKAMSYGHMNKREAELEQQIEDLFKRAEQEDRSEDARYGEGQSEEDLPEELRHRESRLAKIQQAKAELEAEAREARASRLREQAEQAKQAAEAAQDEAEKKRAERRALNRETKANQLDPKGRTFKTPENLPMHRPPSRPNGTPHDRAQWNFTDSDSRLVGTEGNLVQGYNCQSAVDDANQIIVAQAVTNQSPDSGNLLPMLELVKQVCDAEPQVAVADTGYWSRQALEQGAATSSTELLIAVERRHHWDKNTTVTSGEPPAEATPREKMAWKLRTVEGRANYAQRMKVVEPTFGQIKEARGFRRFLLRGLQKVSGEWSMVCTGHNLLKLFRSGASFAS